MQAVGNTRLKTGHLPQAQETLTAALTNATGANDTQRADLPGDLAAVPGDLAAAEAAQHHPQAACGCAAKVLPVWRRSKVPGRGQGRGNPK